MDGNGNDKQGMVLVALDSLSVNNIHVSNVEQSEEALIGIGHISATVPLLMTASLNR